MSSLAASRADNFYYPPEWRPEFGSRDKFAGSKGSNQYQTHGVIRYELQFDAWCLKCKRHMGKGLRFNAKKEKDGKYFSTTIYKFTMGCYSCDQQFVIKTDPKSDSLDNGYICVEGLRKMEQEYVPATEDLTIEVPSDEHKYDMEHDAIYRLNHMKEGEKRALVVKERLQDLQALVGHQKGNDDFALNSKLRQIHRAKRVEVKETVEEGRKRGLAIAILPASQSDADKAAEISFNGQSKRFRGSEKVDKLKIMNESIFSSDKTKRSSCPPQVSSLQPHKGMIKKSHIHCDVVETDTLANMKKQEIRQRIAEPHKFAVACSDSNEGGLNTNINVKISSRTAEKSGSDKSNSSSCSSSRSVVGGEMQGIPEKEITTRFVCKSSETKQPPPYATSAALLMLESYCDDSDS